MCSCYFICYFHFCRESLRNENQTLKEAVEKLERQVHIQLSSHQNSYFDFEHIAHSDDKVFQYTGLPSKEIFNIVLETLSELEFTYVLGWSVTNISKKNQLFMTLMKLRMDLQYFDLAQRFNCSAATVSNIVRTDSRNA